MKFKYLFLIVFSFSCVNLKQAENFPIENMPPIINIPVIENCIADTNLSVHLLMGNPSCAKTIESNTENYLLLKKQYVLSYNNSRGQANWVSWHLNSEWIGSVERQNDFRNDDSLPLSFQKITDKDYKNSGFDRGHICPSGDRTNTEEDNSATFLMTNMMPQSPKNNRNTWRFLEQYQRTLVNEGNEIYIIAGGYGIGGVGKEGFAEKIKDGLVVPERTWKILLVLPEGENDISRINAQTKIIAVDMPNSEIIGKSKWTDYISTVKELELKTGLDFFKTLSPSIQTEIENRKFQIK